MTDAKILELYRRWQTLVWKPAPRSERISTFNKRNERIRKAKLAYDLAVLAHKADAQIEWNRYEVQS